MVGELLGDIEKLGGMEVLGEEVVGVSEGAWLGTGELLDALDGMLDMLG